MASLDDLAVNGVNLVKAVNQLTAAIQAIFPRIAGSLTLANATTTVVAQTGITATSRVFLQPTSSTAAALVAAPGLYISTTTVGASFTISTVSGTAAGTETLNYFVINTS